MSVMVDLITGATPIYFIGAAVYWVTNLERQQSYGDLAAHSFTWPVWAIRHIIRASIKKWKED